MFINQQHSNNANFLSFPYNLKSFMCLSMFMKICPDIPHPQRYWQNRELPPFVSTTRPTWMILVFLWNYSSLSLSSRSFSLEKSIPYLISNYYSLPSMISMQQIVPPSKFVIPITAIYLALFVAFFCNQIFITKHSFSSYISIVGHIKISSNFVNKKHHVRSGKLTLFNLQPNAWD